MVSVLRLYYFRHSTIESFTVMMMLILVYIVCVIVHLQTIPTDSDKNKNTLVDVPVLVKKFTRMIQKSKQSIFHKSKGFKWRCGSKCDTQRRMFNVLNENQYPYSIIQQTRDEEKGKDRHFQTNFHLFRMIKNVNFRRMRKIPFMWLTRMER